MLAAGRKPNVLLVIARGWRGLATPWARDPDLKAPHLEAFAKDAIVFPRAYAAYPHPAPARAAIASGCFPHHTGTFGDGALKKDQPTLESALRNAGYRIGTQEPPFFASVTLEPSRPNWRPDPAALHLRENIPQETNQIRQALAQRYGSYAAMDEQFGKLLDAAGASNTIVVFTSDAGEQIGSQGLEGDDTFYEESARVPLAIRIPGVRPSASDLFVSHVDLMPTILGLCGEPGIEDVQGRDLSGLVTTRQGDRPESIFSEGRIGQRDEWRMLIVGYDKIVVDAGGDPTHLYNLAEDHFELKNLVHEPQLELKRAQLLATLRAERSRLLDFRRR